jgi:glycosyltransferase involved in cell wall biosynthesis
MSAQAPLVLSVFATFAIGGPQVRFAAVANHHGRAWRHAIIAMDGRYHCAERLISDLDVTFPEAPATGSVLGNQAAFRHVLRRLAPDVLVTHNWGSIEWVLANVAPHRLVPHVHIEDGFGPEEASLQLRRRVLARRLLLRRSTVVLPSRTLNTIATEVWRLPPSQLNYVPNGLDLKHFRPAAAPPARVRPDRAGPPLIGTVAALRTEKNLSRLLRAARLLRDEELPFRLAIIGDGPERRSLEALTAELRLADCVSFEGAQDDPAQAYRNFDIFALSSDTEQMPLSVLEAMATGLPVAATRVGDVPSMVAEENRPCLVEKDDAALAAALRTLVRDPDMRQGIGAANRLKAEREYDAQVMFRRYHELLGKQLQARFGDSNASGRVGSLSLPQG